MEERFTRPDGWLWGRLTNADGARLRYGLIARHQNPVANIVMVGGLSEFAEKYFETIRDMDALGYNCYFMDTMGQGGSGRYLSDHFKRHSLGFDREKRDLLQFIDQCVPGYDPRVILSHSMGALPTLLTALDAPGKIQAAALTAPLLGFETFPAKGFECLLAKFPFSQTFMESYIPDRGPWRPRTHPGDTRPPPEMYSSDPERMPLHDEWMENDPRLRIGGPTRGVIVHASKTIMALRTPGVVESLKIPLKIFSAGQDFLVNNRAIFNMAARLPNHPENNEPHIHLPTAKHDILMETDNIRRPVLQEINRFFQAHI